VGQLARVLTPENESAVLPRFFGRSAREAMEVVAELAPRPAPPVREVVTALGAPPLRAEPQPAPLALDLAASRPAGGEAAPAALHTYEVNAPARVAPGTPSIEPLTADLRRLHLTVSKEFLDKVSAARTGLSHALPGASTEQVLSAALDLLLEKQARSKALVKRPRKAPASAELAPPTPTSPSRRPHLPAAIARAVRLRDGDRCQFPVDGGGVCGSTWQVELDHAVPVALGGATTVANLRSLCAAHHRRESERLLGPAAAGQRTTGRSKAMSPSSPPRPEPAGP